MAAMDLPVGRPSREWIRAWLMRGPSAGWVDALVASKRCHRVAFFHEAPELTSEMRVLEPDLVRALESSDARVVDFARELLAFLDDPYAQRATLRGKEKGTAPRRPAPPRTWTA